MHGGGNVQRDREVSPLATADEAVVDPHFGLLIDGVKMQQCNVAQKALRHRESAAVIETLAAPQGAAHPGQHGFGRIGHENFAVGVVLAAVGRLTGADGIIPLAVE